MVGRYVNDGYKGRMKGNIQLVSLEDSDDGRMGTADVLRQIRDKIKVHAFFHIIVYLVSQKSPCTSMQSFKGSTEQLFVTHRRISLSSAVTLFVTPP